MWLLMVTLGAAVGMVGTLVGAGGGFLAVPVLLLAFRADPVSVAGTSLVMVTANAAAGALAYWRQGRIDWRTAGLLIAASLPGTLLGAWAGPHLPAQQFRLLFGLLLMGLAVWTTWKAVRPPVAVTAGPGSCRFCTQRTLVLRDGSAHSYRFSVPLAVGFALAIGFLGAVLGIGGGPLMVPAMLFGLQIPLAIATASSQVMIAVSSAGAAAVYAAGGRVDGGQALALALGALAGAPLGAWLSRRVRGVWVVLILALLLGLLGVRLVL